MAWGNKHEDRSLRELLRLETLQRRKNKSLHRGKTGIKLNIQKTKIMASGPISSWQIDGETMPTVRNFIFLGSKITEMMTAAMKSKDTCFLEEKL